MSLTEASKEIKVSLFCATFSYFEVSDTDFFLQIHTATQMNRRIFYRKVAEYSKCSSGAKKFEN